MQLFQTRLTPATANNYMSTNGSVVQVFDGYSWEHYVETHGTQVGSKMSEGDPGLYRNSTFATDNMNDIKNKTWAGIVHLEEPLGQWRSKWTSRGA